MTANNCETRESSEVFDCHNKLSIKKKNIAQVAAFSFQKKKIRNIKMRSKLSTAKRKLESSKRERRLVLFHTLYLSFVTSIVSIHHNPHRKRIRNRKKLFA